MPAGNETTRAYPLRVAAWTGIPRLVHGFLGREHGLPPGPFTPDDIRTRLHDAGEHPVGIAIAAQVHGAQVLSPETPGVTHDAHLSDAGPFPKADALVSASADIILTIRTADCVPILIVAPRSRAVAAIHAGWRGTVSGVIRTTIQALHDRYGAKSNELHAAIGPAIGFCCYEFGTEHLDRFREAFGPEVERTWHPRADAPSAARRVKLDLREIARLALEQCGVPSTAVTVVGPCTADSPSELHSFRRDAGAAGRQLSYIGWRA